MFQGMITQLTNISKSIYDKDACQTFILQAYQESIYLKTNFSSSEIDPLLQDFYKINEALIEALSSRYKNNTHTLYFDSINLLIDKMKQFDSTPVH